MLTTPQVGSLFDLYISVYMKTSSILFSYYRSCWFLNRLFSLLLPDSDAPPKLQVQLLGHLVCPLIHSYYDYGCNACCWEQTGILILNVSVAIHSNEIRNSSQTLIILFFFFPPSFFTCRKSHMIKNMEKVGLIMSLIVLYICYRRRLVSAFRSLLKWSRFICMLSEMRLIRAA